MAGIIPLSISPPNVGAVLLNGDDLFVSDGVTVATTETTGVLHNGDDSRVIVHGTVIGLLGVRAAGTLNASIEVGEKGRITGFGNNALYLTGTRVVNAGVIESLDPSYAVMSLEGDVPNATASVANAGLAAGGFGIYLTGAITSSNLDNSGTIRVGSIAFRDLAGSADAVRNPGLIVGDVLLGGNGDRYDGRGGRLVGDLFGEGGGDRLTGGTGPETMSGGAGRDVLTGGGGAARFVFDAAPGGANRDEVTDFGRADRLVLDHADFAGLALGGLAAGAFRADASGRAGDASDRVTYETDTGLLRYDADGRGGEAGLVFALLDAGLDLSANNFLVI